MKTQFNTTYQASHELEKKALQWAQAQLNRQGVYYPIPDSRKSPEENHNAILSYAQKENALVHEYYKHQTQSSSPAKQSEKHPEQKQWRDWNDR